VGTSTITTSTPSKIQKFPKNASHGDNTAQHPELACKAVGLVPVFLIGQGPGELDAHGVGLGAFGKQVAYNQEHQSHQQRHNDLNAQRVAQSGGVDEGIYHQSDHRADPQHELDHLGAVILVLGIGGAGKHAHPVQHQQQRGHGKYSGGFAAPAIHVAVDVPVRGDLLRKLIPQQQANGDGHEQNDGGQDQKTPIFLDHSHSPFKSVIQSMISSRTDAFRS